MTSSLSRKYLLALLLLLPGSLLAQWQTTTYTLKGGWNAIYLTGDVKYGTLETNLPTSVQEVWRWNPDPGQATFTESPLIPAANQPEWSIWRRGVPADSSLTQLTGRSSYLVKCAGSAGTTYSVPIKQSPVPPGAAWVRAGANLLGFPTLRNGANYPLFSNYFATFPSAISSTAKIFKYVGGDLGSGNPMQIFAPTTERVDRTQAYWFSSEVVGTFYAPIEISSEVLGGIGFGRTGTVVKVLVRNRSTSAITLTIAPVSSETAPAGVTDLSGPVPVRRRQFDAATTSWTETAITASYPEAVAPQTTIELYFGIDRALMTGSAGAMYGSFLRFTESANLVDIMMPVTAEKASLSGLWVGDVSLTNVASKVTNPARAKTTIANGQVTTIALEGTGGFGYTTAPLVTIEAPENGTAATATCTVAAGSVNGFTLTTAGSGYTRAPVVTVAAPPPLPGSTVPRNFSMRTLLHLDNSGVARLLSQVYLGQLAAAPYSFGIATREAHLNQDALGTAQRLVSTAMPLDQVIDSGGGGSGTVAMPGQLVRVIQLPYDDATNPFVHQYHPDHDNLNARFSAKLPNKVESHTVNRTCTFTFTTVPPVDSISKTGWGSRVIGGYYQEIISGLNKTPIQISGYFELRRASELGTITLP